MGVFSYKLNKSSKMGKNTNQQVYARKRHYFDVSRLLGDPFGITTISLAIIGWLVAVVSGICFIYLPHNSLTSENIGFPKFTWWGLGFQIFLIFIYMILYCFDLLDHYRVFITCTTAISFVYNTNSTTNLIYSSGKTKAASASGCIILSVINFTWLLYFGSDNSSPLNRFIDSFSLDGQRPSNIVSEYLQDRRLANMKRLQQQKQQMSRYQELQKGMSSGYANSTQYVSNLNETSVPPSRSQQQDDNLIPEEENTGSISDEFHNPINVAAPSTSKFTNGQSNSRHNRNHTTQPSQSLSNARTSIISYADPSEEEAIYPYKAVAIFEYVADASDPYEISFDEGEVMRVTDIEGRWWSCLKTNGERGIIPSNYVKLLD
ncbi:hypothetical protein FOG50_02274 [Hanseniaspora uvarum]|nr:hypothetical protein FOG50_02274 [Hanseniaspora uvarum]